MKFDFVHCSISASPNSIWKLITPFDANILLIFLGIGVTIACHDVIFYVVF